MNINNEYKKPEFFDRYNFGFAFISAMLITGIFYEIETCKSLFLYFILPLTIKVLGDFVVKFIEKNGWKNKRKTTLLLKLLELIYLKFNIAFLAVYIASAVALFILVFITNSFHSLSFINADALCLMLLFINLFFAKLISTYIIRRIYYKNRQNIGMLS